MIATISEAREMVADDMRLRMRNLENGGAPNCPEIYRAGHATTMERSAVTCQLDATTVTEVEW